MEQPTDKDVFRFDDRREYNDGPPNGVEERRVEHRREDDQYRADIKTVLDLEMDETVTDQEVNKVLGPVLENIKAGKYK